MASFTGTAENSKRIRAMRSAAHVRLYSLSGGCVNGLSSVIGTFGYLDSITTGTIFTAPNQSIHYIYCTIHMTCTVSGSDAVLCRRERCTENCGS